MSSGDRHYQKLQDLAYSANECRDDANATREATEKLLRRLEQYHGEGFVMTENWRTDYWLKPAGLMRCCLMSLDKFMKLEATEPPKEGDTLQCRYHGGYGMIFSDMEWKSNIPADVDWT